MKVENIRWIMYLLIVLGILLIVIGAALMFFTDIHIKKGVEGVLIISGLMGLGIFLALPAKIYLTIQYLKNKEK